MDVNNRICLTLIVFLSYKTFKFLILCQLIQDDERNILFPGANKDRFPLLVFISPTEKGFELRIRFLCTVIDYYGYLTNRRTLLC